MDEEDALAAEARLGRQTIGSGRNGRRRQALRLRGSAVTVRPASPVTTEPDDHGAPVTTQKPVGHRAGVRPGWWPPSTSTAPSPTGQRLAVLVAVQGRRRVVAAGLALLGKLAAAALFGGRYADEPRKRSSGAPWPDSRPTRRRRGPPPSDSTTTAGGPAPMSGNRWSGTAPGHHLVIVSASLETYLVPVGQELGVDTVVATAWPWRRRSPDRRLRRRQLSRRREDRRVRQWMEARSRRPPTTPPAPLPSQPSSGPTATAKATANCSGVPTSVSMWVGWPPRRPARVPAPVGSSRSP